MYTKVIRILYDNQNILTTQDIFDANNTEQFRLIDNYCGLQNNNYETLTRHCGETAIALFLFLPVLASVLVLLLSNFADSSSSTRFCSLSRACIASRIREFSSMTLCRRRTRWSSISQCFDQDYDTPAREGRELQRRQSLTDKVSRHIPANKFAFLIGSFLHESVESNTIGSW